MDVTIIGQNKKELLSLIAPLLPRRMDGAVKADPGVHKTDGILISEENASDHSRNEILIITGGNSRFFKRFPNACGVTCGMSARDSVSCSSISDSQAVVSVVRELPIVCGGRVDVQDVCVSLRAPAPADRLSMAVAALLCAGLAPEEIVGNVF